MPALPMLMCGKRIKCTTAVSLKKLVSLRQYIKWKIHINTERPIDCNKILPLIDVNIIITNQNIKKKSISKCNNQPNSIRNNQEKSSS